MNYLVIPAYEPDKRLIKLLVSLQGYSSLSVIIVNDGSDNTFNSIFEEASLYATVLTHEKNKGKGIALKTAFLYIQDLGKKGIVITADSDGQHTASDIMKVLAKCENKTNTIITGIRCFKGKVPLKSKLGNTITKYIFYLSTRVYLKDTQCGLRAFHTDLIPFMLETEGSRFEYEMNVLLRAAKELQIEGVPIETIYLNNNSKTHFKPVRDAYMIYKNIIKFLMSSIISFIVDYISYIILLNIFVFEDEAFEIILANIVARIISATVNYTLNKNYVFKNKQKHKTTVWKYTCLAVFILAINTSIIMILRNFGLENLYIVKIIAEVILFILSFTVQKLVIFKKKGN